MPSRPYFGSPEPYTRTAIGFHWLIALLIVCAFALGWVMTGIPGLTPTKLRYYSWHKWIGVTVFALAVLRIVWRATHRAPPLPRRMPGWQRVLAHGVHVLLYVLMVAVPVSGYLFSSAANVPVVYLGLVQLPMLIGPDPVLKTVFRTVHVTLDYSLAGLVVLHVAAAIKHQWLDRDGLLSRMIPFLK
ncbi:cytochrome b [Paraburkholderia kururiensis]|uniref:Cytochrome b n=1 Tax=Paraburkholderia kururiensis TaxID=984307 RepID=A0ABZ0WEF4_9BURK|nr:cytochrome b [Paraburkholderia kururiensis]WQD75692.1 cytochrome b [Paraburkholderia kururiensis]